MKNVLFVLAIAIISSFSAMADDRPVDFARLPVPAQEFVKAHYPDIKVMYVTMDDDFIRPDYSLMLSNGVKIDFENSGALDKIECREGAVPDNVVPVQILDYVKAHFPDAYVRGYEIGRRSYEVKLSNRLELKFNSAFHLIELDD